MAPENEELQTSGSGGLSGGDGVGLPGGPQTNRTSKTQLDVWADQAADYVVQGVAWLKARTTVKAQTALRALVYGVVVIVSVIAAFVLLIISLVRIWDVYVPIEPLGRRVWLGYVTFGGLFFIAGAALLLWKGGEGD
jgi:hypothetical protein